MSFHYFSPNFRHIYSIRVISNQFKRQNHLFVPENVFNEFNVKKAIGKFSSMKPFRFHTRQPLKKAAFLIPLCQIEDQVCLLYTIRAHHIKQFGGQVN